MKVFNWLYNHIEASQKHMVDLHTLWTIRYTSDLNQIFLQNVPSDCLSSAVWTGSMIRVQTFRGRNLVSKVDDIPTLSVLSEFPQGRYDKVLMQSNDKQLGMFHILASLPVNSYPVLVTNSTVSHLKLTEQKIGIAIFR